MAKTKAERQAEVDARQDALSLLRENLSPGDHVYTVVVNVSRDGTARSIRALIPAAMSSRHGNRPGIREISYLVARALGDKIDQNYGGVRVHGAGMDMGFHLVYSLSAMLWLNGYQCPGEHCGSNDHVNSPRAPYGPDTHHASGGYALHHNGI